MTPVRPPASEPELLERAAAIAGLTLADLAGRLRRTPPADPVRAKGWAGRLIEDLLGASAGSMPAPDFQQIGVELKTLPINRKGLPVESTYVCTVPLTPEVTPTWRGSGVWRKLRRVLWVPIQADRDLPLAARRVGSPLLWSPDRDEESALRADWEELTDMVCLGGLETISAHHGVYLQIRPKAADGQALGWGIGESGERVPTLPRGFYLRAAFTASILRRHYETPA